MLCREAASGGFSWGILKKGKISHFVGFLFIDSDYDTITVHKLLQTTHMSFLLPNSYILIPDVVVASKLPCMEISR